MTKTLVVILGATATGKTSLSIAIARKLGSPVVSCDSRQIYHEIPIGTAAPTEEEQDGVPHYFVGERSVKEDYNCGKFEIDALELLKKLFKKHDYVVMVGGSGLYVDAVCKGIDDVPATSPELRDEIQERLQIEGLEVLLEELKMLDPEFYEKVDKRNAKRVTRALEVCLQSGKSYTSLREGMGKERDFKIMKFGVTMPRDILYERINKRVDIMLKQGLEDEARAVYPLKELNALQTVGYRELFSYFDQEVTKNEAIELIKRNSRRYAKRQTTWFGRDEEITWVSPESSDEIVEMVCK